MMVKRQKVGRDSISTYREEVLFNSDTLPTIISFLPSVDLLNLAVTCKRLGSAPIDEQSLIGKSAYIATQDIATEEQLAALPYYDGESPLANYHYLQFMRGPLTFDQLLRSEYVNSLDKTCIRPIKQNIFHRGTAISNNILRAGKHYATFKVCTESSYNADFNIGVTRPVAAYQIERLLREQRNISPFYFSRNVGRRYYNKDGNIHCCLYNADNGYVNFSDWSSMDRGRSYEHSGISWEGSESMSFDDEVGLLLELDEGTLSVYKNGRKLGVMKRGLAGPYCWVATVQNESQVTMKRGAIPPS